LPLINTLRESTNSDFKKKDNKAGNKQEGEEDKQSAKQLNTSANPPNFFEDDMQKWKKKFERSIQQRELEKK
jgi:hypothetical protein